MEAKSTMVRLGGILAGGLMLCTASGASAGLMGVKDIVIMNAHAVKTFTNGWLQVTEVVATKTSDGMDAALASAGAMATSSGFSFSGEPENAIDGVGPAAHPAEFHSDSFSDGEFLRIMLSGPMELDSITIFGRSDCCSVRDFYSVSLRDEFDNELFFATELDANNMEHLVTVTLTEPPTGIVEPGMGAIFGLGLAGLAFARRRKAA